ncbi:MAG: hypothetical protein F6K26_41830 [Moorea sp. SIO2I5]|nr:hypothetical protein [Moorena sp. SIO2I5]
MQEISKAVCTHSKTTQDKQRKTSECDWPKATLRDEAKLPLKAISPKGYATRSHTLYISVYLIRYERMGGEFSDSSTPALGEIYPLA